ncbi:unnamed protein product [Pleuronectes platessa]|uniref:Uncharacterized protein n=1 Tax=Pleuronectes platessa TaxID=8262 RepID=A0A9N7YVS0_PLEPL|nr:unnamed protein product [Pleuronectes platessa]
MSEDNSGSSYLGASTGNLDLPHKFFDSRLNSRKLLLLCKVLKFLSFQPSTVLKAATGSWSRLDCRLQRPRPRGPGGQGPPAESCCGNNKQPRCSSEPISRV